jgi:hypothetical protein
MWLKLSGEYFYMGPGGVTVIKEVDRRDKPSSYIYYSELYSGHIRITLVKETVAEIEALLFEKPKKASKKND